MQSFKDIKPENCYTKKESEQLRSATKRKTNKFIDEIETGINNFNQNISDKSYDMTASIINNQRDSDSSDIKYQFKFETKLINERYSFLYEIVKLLDTTCYFDVTDMKVERLQFDANRLRATLLNESKKASKIVKNTGHFFEYDTIRFSKENTTVLRGYELNFIYPIIKQNEQLTMSDEQLNEYIKNYNHFPEF